MKILILATLVMLAAVSVFAGEPKVYTNEELETYKGGTNAQSKPETSSNFRGTRITVDYYEADLYQTLKALAKVARKDDIDVQIDRRIQGKVSIKKTNEPWDKIMDDLIVTHNLSVTFRGDTFVISPR